MKGYAVCYNDKPLAFSGKMHRLPWRHMYILRIRWLQHQLSPKEMMSGSVPNPTAYREKYSLIRRQEIQVEDYLEFYIYNTEWNEDDGVYTKVSASIPTPDNWGGQWHQIAGTFDGENLKLYLDGKEVAAAKDSHGIARGGNAVGIGADVTYDAQNPNVPPVFKGLIDNVYYNKALTPDEIKNLPKPG